MAQVHPLWQEWLSPVTRTEEFQRLLTRVAERSRQVEVYPPLADRYTALSMSPEDVRVVILGQDPYHGPGQAHGLSFSVREGQPLPPSLRNIYKEVEAEGFTLAAGRTGYLMPWHEQGVLLLNAVLSVEKGAAGSHRGWGWERFTDAIVQLLNQHRHHLVFMLWGKDASVKAASVDRTRHLVLSSPHPSPFSADRGFFGNNHFRQANAYLETHGIRPIQW